MEPLRRLALRDRERRDAPHLPERLARHVLAARARKFGQRARVGEERARRGEEEDVCEAWP